MKYLIAWALLGSIVYGGFVAAQSWHNPWARPMSVIDALPASYPGCGSDCK